MDYKKIRELRRDDAAESLRDEIDEYRDNKPRKRKAETLSDSSSDDEPASSVFAQDTSDNFESTSSIDTKGIGFKLMAKHGYAPGAGLGKAGQGIVEPVGLSTQKGRTGLGHEATKVVGRDMSEIWDESQEDKTVEEHVNWFPKCGDEIRREIVANCENDEWTVVATPKYTIDDEAEFCDLEVLVQLMKAKTVFDNITDRELREARQRANPYETIGGVFFLNRAAMKVANMDKVFDWIFTEEIDDQARQNKNPWNFPRPEGDNKPVKFHDGKNTSRKKDVFYFADVCAGPGGFSEYVLWRKGFYNAKGFGFTLKGKDDFKLFKFSASSAHFFEPYYGKTKNGDVTKPDNIDALQEVVEKGTNGIGVNLMMADGGFSVEGRENIQEILSKRIYLCQLLTSLCIVKEGGNFFCKLFDLFTPFSVGLIYLMYVCYDQITIHKPHTSRPANSERYIVCKGLRKEFSDVIRDYLKRVNRTMEKLWLKGEPKESDVMELVPLNIIRDDEVFTKFLVEHNEKFAVRQTVYLNKYLSYAKNPNQFDKDQGNLRDDCLRYWQVPNRPKPGPKFDRSHNSQSNSMSNNDMIAKYGNRLYQKHDLTDKTPDFNPAMFNSREKSVVHEEFCFTFIAENKTRKSLLVSSDEGVGMYENGACSKMDKDMYRIPNKTILLVEHVYAYECINGIMDTSSKRRVIRILDAAVLNGDNISNLSHEDRMASIKKFCVALKLVNREVVNDRFNRATKKYEPDIKNTIEIVCAEYSPSHQMLIVVEQMVEFSKTKRDFFFRENDLFFNCYGVRFNRIIKYEWNLFWSSTTRQIFANCRAYNPNDNKAKAFHNEFETKQVWSSFWDSVYGKHDGKHSPMSCIWFWRNDPNVNYTVHSIVNEESHETGPTVRSVMEPIYKSKAIMK
ncbi:unnamed protein product [Auanema sp. JU1783]|nr:unnamed protein product [Auanema sp. JU1783]